MGFKLELNSSRFSHRSEMDEMDFQTPAGQSHLLSLTIYGTLFILTPFILSLFNPSVSYNICSKIKSRKELILFKQAIYSDIDLFASPWNIALMLFAQNAL